MVYINGIKQKLVKYGYYFNQTENFVELVWNNSINNSRNMFYECSDIIEIDMSNFDTSQITMMLYMFDGCSSLKFLNLSNFNTSQVESMYSMFHGCSLLTSLNLSSFNTSQVTTMAHMFHGCSSLISLNLSNFNNSNVQSMESMFHSCINLQYINLYNFEENGIGYYKSMFSNIQSNFVICIKETDNNKKFLSEIKKKNCSNNYCSDDWRSKQKKLINGTNECIDNCGNELEYKYEYNSKCYQHCPYGNINSSNYQCKCELNKCLTCSSESLSKQLCTQCNNEGGFYKKENDPLNSGDNIECYNNSIKGYYLDNDNKLYKKCFFTCETCAKEGDNFQHNCLECNSDYPLEKELSNGYKDCQRGCKYYHYFNKNKNYYECTTNFSCPDEYPILIKNKSECIKQEGEDNITDKENEFYNNGSKEDNYMVSKEEIEKKIEYIMNISTNLTEIEKYNIILSQIEFILTSGNYNTSKIDDGFDEFITLNKILITLTSTSNQKNNFTTNSNLTRLNLESCEDILRTHYNLTNNETIYIKKIDVHQEKMKIPKIEYDLYAKFNNSNLTKLNISLCFNEKISLQIPIEIKENIDILNSSSDYYRDKCYKSTSDKGTDMLLDDRKREFVENNKTVCQEDCSFAVYDYDNQVANCSCFVQENNNNLENMNINTTKLYENFGEANNKNGISNLGLTSCNVLSSTENIESNTGFYLLLIILIAFIIIFIIFYSKGYNLLKNKNHEVIYKKFEKEEKQQKNKIKKKPLKELIILSSSKKGQKSKKKLNNKKGSKEKENNTNNLFLNNNKKNNNIILENKINKNQENNNNKPDTDYEFNWLSYEEALKYDKRTSCEYYGSLLRSKQLVIFTFCSFEDYNSGVIKKFMFLFIFRFTLYS